MKKLICLGLSVIVAFSLLTGCKSSKESTNQTTTTASTTTKKYDEIDSTIKRFFIGFEKGRFDIMKKYCTKGCIKNFFHKTDFCGMKNGTFISSDTYRFNKNEDKVAVGIIFNVTWSKEVYKDNDGERYYIWILKKEDNNKWLIDSITTDLSAIND